MNKIKQIINIIIYIKKKKKTYKYIRRRKKIKPVVHAGAVRNIKRTLRIELIEKEKKKEK